MIEAILAIVAGLFAALPQILTWIEARSNAQKKSTDALVQRDLDVLHGPPTGGVQPPK